MNHLNDQAVEQFNVYPEVIRNQLIELFSYTLDNVDLDNIEGVLLIGSTARGEVSFQIKYGSLDIFSDYEFIIVTKRAMSSENISSLKKGYALLEKKWGVKSPLFSVDFGVCTLSKWRLTPPTLWSYEAKTYGLLIYGNDVRKYLPEVSLDSLDIGNLNELIIVRLWNMLIHINDNCVLNKSTEYEEFILKFYYCRNILDVLTIYLPNIGSLRAGYKTRLEYFLKNEHNSYLYSIKNEIVNAHKLKLDGIDEIDFQTAQKSFLDSYLFLMRMLSGREDEGISVDSLKKIINELKKRGVFSEKIIRRIRRLKMELDVLVKLKGVSLDSLRWFLNDVRYDLLGFLICMHLSISKEMDRLTSLAFIDEAIRYRNLFTGSNMSYDDGLSFEQNWLNVRESILDFMMIWFYGRTNTSKNDVLAIMKWSDS